jgi:transketolase
MAGAGHTGGSLSCVDILNVLYNRILNVTPKTFNDPGRDRYIQSKGHSVEALYVVLADRGFFPESKLETLCRYRSHYVGHPTRKVNGIEHNTGALGHGLAFSVGVALSAKKDSADYKVYTLLGDGELVEGSNWESLLSAAHYNLDNLTVIIDRNNLQITGRTEDVCGIEPLEAKFTAFGWSVKIVDGHDITAMTEVLSTIPFETNKPNMVIANTIKGKGVSFIENDSAWHHRVPTDEQYKTAQEELDRLLTGFKL